MADRHAAPTLLIGEDDRALSAMLTDLFTDEGYLVDVAHDGQQGLHRGLTGSYDAVIVDRGLPVMGGAEVVAVLRLPWKATRVEWSTSSTAKKCTLAMATNATANHRRIESKRGAGAATSSLANVNGTGPLYGRVP